MTSKASSDASTIRPRSTAVTPMHQQKSSRHHRSGLEPHGTIGQLSFVPAIQTTVVKTMTTTTTKFPPLHIRPPRHAHELDTKLYPLATVPTPAALRNISFTVDGRTARFREENDASLALEEVRGQSMGPRAN